MKAATVSTEYERRGIDVLLLENGHLRVEVLAGKGGDVTEIRDKRTDTNVLFETPHRWRAPGEHAVEAPDGEFAFLDHYPGGWQNVAPNAGGPATVHGATLGLHGSAALTPWDVTVESRGPDRVVVELRTELGRYPLSMTRRLALPAGDSTLSVADELTNVGQVRVPYAWLQHLAFGPPLVGPEATVSVPCETVLVDESHDDPNARFAPGATGEWPTPAGADGDPVDLRSIPPKSATVHDLLRLTDLAEGRYEIANPELDLSVAVTFPPDLYEYVWYWGAFGGFEAAPFFGRNYTLGLEPCTSVPNAGLERAIEDGTANQLAPGETIEAEIAVETGSV